MQHSQVSSQGKTWHIQYIKIPPDELSEEVREGYRVYLAEAHPQLEIGRVYKVSANGWVYSSFPKCFPKMRFQPMTKWQRFDQRHRATLALIKSVSTF